MTMKRMPSATLGLAALGVVLVGCATTSPSMELGSTFYRNGEYVSAADAFTDAIASSPRSAAAWNNRAAARLRSGEVNRAIADYNTALELAPRDAEIYYNRANALVAAGQYQDAIADYTRAVEIDPNFSKAIFNRGTAYAMLGQRDAAQADWSSAISVEPDPWTKSAMRRSARLDGPPAMAVVKSIELQPAVAPAPPPGTGPATVPLPQPAASPRALDARALASRAITRELDGDRAGAIQDLRSAMALEPDASRRASIANLIRLLDAPR
jgi:hypothetical protein